MAVEIERFDIDYLPQRVSDAVFFLPPENPHRFSANTTAIIKNGSVLLIDPGSTHSLARLENQLEHLGTAVTNISGILATHVHLDHINGDTINALKTKSPHAHVIIPEKGLQVAGSDNEFASAAFLYDSHAAPFIPDSIVNSLDTISFGDITIDVIESPGHTEHCVSYVIHDNNQQILVGGDAIWGSSHQAIGSDKTIWKHSLSTLNEIPFTKLIPGHGNPTTSKDTHDIFKQEASIFGKQTSASFHGMVSWW